MKKFTKYTRGFTLIELLVVIAIIGILASVVLVSLGGARGKAGDSAVKSNLDTIRTQAEMYASDNGNTYGSEVTTADACPTAGTSMFSADSTIKSAIKGALDQGSGFNACMTDDTTSNDATKWAVISQYKSDPTKAWCVDSSGASKELTVVNSQAGVNAKLSGGLCGN